MNPDPRMAAKPATADIVILGAGVMGASIAFHLAQRKAGKIVVIDKGHVGQGGSGRSSALDSHALQLSARGAARTGEPANVPALARRGRC